MAPRLTVVCVLKTGGEYTPGHVERLREDVEANLTLDHRFVCVTDDVVTCQNVRLKHGWPGWWSKIELFRPGVLRGPVLYLDLDTRIVSNIDDIALGHRFTILHNMSRGKGWPGSGVMAWDADLSGIYQAFAQDPNRWMRECTTSDCWGDQGFIGRTFTQVGLYPTKCTVAPIGVFPLGGRL
jgi:hypothetical protein